jgi:hypothetical protein
MQLLQISTGPYHAQVKRVSIHTLPNFENLESQATNRLVFFDFLENEYKILMPIIFSSQTLSHISNMQSRITSPEMGDAWKQ